MAGEDDGRATGPATIGYQLNSDMTVGGLYIKYKVAGEDKKFESSNPLVFAAFLEGFYEGIRHDKIKESNK